MRLRYKIKSSKPWISKVKMKINIRDFSFSSKRRWVPNFSKVARNTNFKKKSIQIRNMKIQSQISLINPTKIQSYR